MGNNEHLYWAIKKSSHAVDYLLDKYSQLTEFELS